MTHKYFKSLQILRALAFLSIFFFHVTVLDDTFSRWSITVFLMLSGFLNALHGYEKDIKADVRSSWKYATRKIKKLYPLHLVMLVVALGLYMYSFRTEIMQNFKSRTVTESLKILSNIFLVSDWGPKSGWWYNVFSEYNIVTWYLSLSLLLFILTPLFMGLMHRLYDNKSSNYFWSRPIIVSLVIYLVTIVINLTLVKELGPSEAFLYTYESPISRIGDYLIALQLGYIYLHSQHGKDIKENSKLAVTAVVLSILVSCAFIYLGTSVLSGDNKWIVSTGFYFTIPTAILIYFLAKTEDKISKLLDSGKAIKAVTEKVLYLGTISQYAFLIHVPVINLVHGVYSKVGDVNIWVWSVIAFGITMIGSWLVEKRRRKEQENEDTRL
ncbi:acyltransferase family protein [Butyrivibrio hungatei]|uniref:Acyltransferase n=1 Tax=Butyrivibrio hungatei TaxID=185008 RepID=A0A1D9NYV1_9FIRM|nr:acyltransferase [Butyrivibrio hungatei]AOZ95460.1 acyltransferase [Butyrivibrio hungatei]